MAAGIVLTNNGEEWSCERLAGVQGAGTNNVFANAGSHIGWGTSITTPVKADTGLTAESADPAARVATSVTVTAPESRSRSAMADRRAMASIGRSERLRLISGSFVIVSVPRRYR